MLYIFVGHQGVCDGADPHSTAAGGSIVQRRHHTRLRTWSRQGDQHIYEVCIIHKLYSFFIFLNTGLIAYTRSPL